MKNLRRLNSKEKKVLVKNMVEHYGFDGEFTYDVLFNENRGKYYLINPDVLEYPIEKHRIETIGMYFGQLMPEGVVRFTVDGSQIVGPHCSQNIFVLSDELYHEWIRGRDLQTDPGMEGWLLIKHNEDFCGSGKVVRKSETGEEKVFIHNYVPKARYVRSED